MQQYSDEQLMRMIREKKSEALHELYDRYARLVYSFAMKSRKEPQFAKEIVQLVFTRLWTTERSYDPAKGLFVNWLLTVTRNLTVDQLRKLRKQEALMPFEPWSAELAAGESSVEDALSKTLLKEQMEQACKYLNEQQTRLIRLLYWEGYSLSEIAAMNGEPVGTVKSRLHQTLKLLRRHLTPWREE
ncbi:sigma-70 family RNA polymerase sigma factor [Paenibacillus filicis]|uniref:Sigma-70 family RNA polymerase sigma factor n=1 Tax=Paenibacillus gyeongsangnamensis TaxID=3388067 RepID=A0ABT4Q354_9BACL|nr:sigma-70 family RNA polymerase sigma factor [Paenibacillus filicis]MCZ8511308.1 sigma-70 family RNA polymerase sigma factor [Paenibacillus filicis]